MIAKRIFRDKGTSDFGRLGAYVLNARSGVDPASWLRLDAYVLDAAHQGEKVAWARVSNCRSEDPGWAVKEILATQARNTRSRADKSYHLVASFPEGEKPTREQIENIEDGLCAALGFAEHQRVSAVHQNTDNWHLHIAINKVHPESFRNIEPFRDHFRLQEACAALEIKHGLIRDNHTLEADRKGQGRGNRLRSREADFSVNRDGASFLGWVRDNAVAALIAAHDSGKGWGELHHVAEAHGLEIKPRGAGLVIGDRNEARLHVKASDVDRGLSFRALTKPLGPFQPSGEAAHVQEPQTSYRRPERTEALNDTYQRQRAAAIAAREAATAALRMRHLAHRRELSDWYQRRFRQERLSGLSGVLRYQSFRHLIAERKRDRVEWLAREATERRRLKENHPIPTWSGWLEAEAAHGDSAALAALRRRRANQPRRGLIGMPSVEPSDAGHDRPVIYPELWPAVRRDGRVIYRTDDGGIVADEARHVRINEVSLGATRLALALAGARFGHRPLVVRGTDTFRRHVANLAGHEALGVTFADPVLERQRAQIRNGSERQHRDGGIDR